VFIFINKTKSTLKQSIIFFTLLFSSLLAAQQVPVLTESIADLSETDAESNSSLNQIKFVAGDGFDLSGQYYPGKSDYSAVLLLHDCNHDSSSYEELSLLLSGFGLHVLSLDLRGFGASTSAEFSHQTIKRNAKDIVNYQSEVIRITSFWESDILASYHYLRSKIEKTSDIAVVSSGCSTAQAVSLAANMRVNSFVMLTPMMDYMEREQYKNLIDIPVYFIGSIHHAETYQTTKELFEWNGDKRSTFQTFKGNGFGNYLLRRKRYLANDIAFWLNDILVK